ncbi:hypothetical protein [Chitinophaga filiformis]|uniref:Uncharacterized protein n=1 Tax=Chitinophaga filiformis TaxID=104663 RepID=A0A1G7RTZ6_CHIFI|nr:hypothetical protein [Chitinophaga filiformis]SDG14212.1 hypothetical protein SAMN04488121_103613 [Chitinophaga filiformis]
MSTEKKSAVDKAAESLEVEKLTESEAGKLEGGFSDAVSESDESGGGLNISKCYCTGTPTTT